MLKLLLSLILSGLLALPAFAQEPPTLQDQLRLLSERESRILRARQTLRVREAGIADPLWVMTEPGVPWVVEAQSYELEMRQVMDWALTLGLARFSNRRFDDPFLSRYLPEGTIEKLVLQYGLGANLAELAIAPTMERVRERSDAIRLATYERMAQALADTRTEFVRVQTELAALQSGQGAVSLDIAGTWRGCDGREVTFTGTTRVTGSYSALGPALPDYGFEIGEVGYMLTATDTPGVYTGKVLWKYAGGTGEPYWVNMTATVAGDSYSDTGSDGCSRQMTRVTE